LDGFLVIQEKNSNATFESTMYRRLGVRKYFILIFASSKRTGQVKCEGNIVFGTYYFLGKNPRRKNKFRFVRM